MAFAEIWGRLVGKIVRNPNSPHSAWSAQQREGGCGRRSTNCRAVLDRWLLPQSGWVGSNLESSADTEDTVVGLLGRKTLEGSLDGQIGRAHV